MIALAGVGAVIAGFVPQALIGPSRVIWIDPDPSVQVTCRLTAPRAWQCDGAFDPSRGLVVIVGENGLTYHRMVAGESGGAVVKRWGRVVIVTPGSVAPEDTRDVRITAWAPARSRTRLQTKRFVAVEETAIDIIRLAESIFWIAGGDSDPEAFVTLDGAAVGSTRIALTALAEGPPETPIYLPAAMPFSLAGRVQTAKGADADGVDVELFQTLPTRADDPSIDLASQSLIRAATTRSDQNGRFAFDRLATGPFLISVIDGTRGRGVSVVRSLGEPVVVRLAAPIHATGRVLRNRLPLPDARVRFIPNTDAFMASTDARELVSQERATDTDGRFTFQLPPLAAGTLQIIGPDGVSTRVQIPRPVGDGNVDVGDVMLPDHRQLTIRLMSDEACVLTATGPIGGLGLTIVRGSATGPLHSFDIPEPGQWYLVALCGGRGYDIDPLIVEIAPSGPGVTIDARIVK